MASIVFSLTFSYAITLTTKPIIAQTVEEQNISYLPNSNPGDYTEILSRTDGIVEFTSVSYGLGEENFQETETFIIVSVPIFLTGTVVKPSELLCVIEAEASCN